MAYDLLAIAHHADAVTGVQRIITDRAGHAFYHLSVSSHSPEEFSAIETVCKIAVLQGKKSGYRSAAFVPDRQIFRTI